MARLAVVKRRLMHAARMAVVLVLVLVAGLTACTHSPTKQPQSRVPVRATQDTTVTQDGATLFLPAGSVDRDTTARIARATQTPPNGAPVWGYDFDIGEAKIIAPVRLTLPALREPDVGPDGTTLVPFLSHGQWGTEVGRYDGASRTITLTVNHLSWYGDMVETAYQWIRTALGEWLANFRAQRLTCNDSGPAMRYPLRTMTEPPVFACVNGDDSGGTLTVANNRGFYLTVNPQRGLTIHDVQITGDLDAATSGGGAVIRYLAKWHSLPLPPTATAEFTYRPVAGGPALSFAPDPAATFVSVVLTLFAGISDRGSFLLRTLECMREMQQDGIRAAGSCAADALKDGIENRGWIGARQTFTFAGITVPRSMLGLLAVVLRAIPALDMAIEARDGGSESTIQIDAKPHIAPIAPTRPAPTAQAGTPTPPPAPPQAPTDRFAVASYDRLAAGASHAEWYQAWQDFTAKSNTLTRLAINVGDPRWAAGPIPVMTKLRLCRDSGCTQQVGEWSAQIVNYGTTAVDIGDVPVKPGAVYYLRYDRPDSAHSWAVYFWGPGQYDNLSVSIYGYNRNG